MRVLYPGHRYALANLEGGGETILQFHQDPALHNGEGAEGPTCQEVLRAVIDRVQELDREKADPENVGIVYDLRHSIAGFEARAMRRRVEKDGLEIERLPVAADGHLLLASDAVDRIPALESALADMLQMASDLCDGATCARMAKARDVLAGRRDRDAAPRKAEGFEAEGQQPDREADRPNTAATPLRGHHD